MDDSGRAAIAVLEANVRNIDANLIRVENKVDRLGEKVDAGFKDMRDESKKDLKWTMGMSLLILGAMGSGFLWLADRLEKQTPGLQVAPAQVPARPAGLPHQS